MPSFIKSGLIRILHQHFTHSLYVYVGETIMPPLVLASGPKPCGGKNENVFLLLMCLSLSRIPHPRIVVKLKHLISVAGFQISFQSRVSKRDFIGSIPTAPTKSLQIPVN